MVCTHHFPLGVNCAERAVASTITTCFPPSHFSCVGEGLGMGLPFELTSASLYACSTAIVPSELH